MEQLRKMWDEKVEGCQLPTDEDLGRGVYLLAQAPGALAIFKPAGLTSEDATGVIATRCPTVSMVSRLDAMTSGVMPLALGVAGSKWLKLQFTAQRVSKEYLCLCTGPVMSGVGTISAALSNVMSETGMKSAWSELGKEARTDYEVLEVFPKFKETGPFYLLRCSPHSGRRHQIRSHLAGVQRPLVGDVSYGGLLRNWCPRLFLHCLRLKFLDLTGSVFQVSAELPQDLKSPSCTMERWERYERPRPAPRGVRRVSVTPSPSPEPPPRHPTRCHGQLAPYLDLRMTNPSWFGAAVSAVTENAAELPFPFPLALAKVVEEHVHKAVVARQIALESIRQASGAEKYDETLKQFFAMVLEGSFTFDTGAYPLRVALLETCGFSTDTNLSMLHRQEGAKDLLLRRLTEDPRPFQQIFDRFVREVCVPRIAEVYQSAVGTGLDSIYYQVFPCLRIVQPGDFSIGPHADVAYGHHPCSVNIYVPLTPINRTSSLFLESAPGRADWHPIVGDYGMVKHFPGAVCAHWTTENNTQETRVSLDVRLICGPLFHALRGDEKKDLFQSPKAGYYIHCIPSSHGWQRATEPLPLPDARFGFPWTVKDWEKLQRKRSFVNRPVESRRLSESPARRSPERASKGKGKGWSVGTELQKVW
eukprot:symbB.v1.2.004501.t1/scaffold250.1/size251770/12